MNSLELILDEQISQNVFDGSQQTIKSILLNRNKIIIYGAGSGFVTLNLFVLERYNIPVDLILDRKFGEEDSRDGVRICHPDRYDPTADELKNSVVIVTLGDDRLRTEIIENLKKKGFSDVIAAMDIYEYHLPNPTPELAAGYSFYNDRRAEIFAAFSLFHEQQSRAVFFHFLKVHLTRSNLKIPSRPLAEQYFAPDIFHSPDRSRYICCGAYDGDTIKQFHRDFGKFEALACFEPDEANFKKLVHSLNTCPNEFAKELLLFPCGVFSCEKQLHFSSGRKTNCMLSEQGDSMIQCVAIDHVIRNFKPTFMTMDIEGAELSALQGASEIISDYRPDLSICVYHSPEHIWEIPLLLHNMQLGYHFYLRNYTSFSSETVLYATTK